MNDLAPIISDEETTHTLSSTSTIERSYIPPKGEQVPEEMEAPHAEPQGSFFAKTDAMSRARGVYFKAFIGGFFLVVLVIFAVFPIYWGSLWKIPAHPLGGWVVVCP
jgi:hypothetical protein